MGIGGKCCVSPAVICYPPPLNEPIRWLQIKMAVLVSVVLNWKNQPANSADPRPIDHLSEFRSETKAMWPAGLELSAPGAAEVLAGPSSSPAVSISAHRRRKASGQEGGTQTERCDYYFMIRLST